MANYSCLNALCPEMGRPLKKVKSVRDEYGVHVLWKCPRCGREEVVLN